LAAGCHPHDHEDDLLGDVGRMIGDPLEMAGDEQSRVRTPIVSGSIM
jgi:hypothetical protein